MVWSPFIGTGWIPPWFRWPWPGRGRGLCWWLWLNWFSPNWIYSAYPVVESRLLEWRKEILERELKAIEERLKEFRKS